MDELTRFAQRLVEQLGASEEGVHRPVEIAALRETVLPYRKHRRALGIDSVEDYETVLLRLIAGERGYVKTLPAAAAERARKELAQANPDLAVLDEVGDATIQITSMVAHEGGVGIVSEVSSDTTEEPVMSSKPTPEAPSTPPTSLTPPSACPHCKHAIPGERQVVFCPWCGKRLIPFTCARCNTELDSEWRHCITCGAPVKDPFSY